MWRSIFFSFPCIDLKFCKQPPDHCRIINHGLDLNYKVRNCACADLSFLVLHILTWNFLHNFLFVPATISQVWVCSFHTKLCGNCTSTLLLSSLRSRRRYHRAQRDSICLSVIKLLPAYGTDHNQNAHTGSSGHCEDQSRFDIDRSPIPRPTTSPQKWPPKWKFLFFDILTWNFVRNLLTLAAL